jgi:hypothetical protein
MADNSASNQACNTTFGRLVAPLTRTWPVAGWNSVSNFHPEHLARARGFIQFDRDHDGHADHAVVPTRLDIGGVDPYVQFLAQCTHLGPRDATSPSAP